MERRRQRSERAIQLGGEERRGLALRGTELAADALAQGADLGGIAGRVEASGLVRGGEGEIDPGRPNSGRRALAAPMEDRPDNGDRRALASAHGRTAPATRRAAHPAARPHRGTDELRDIAVRTSATRVHVFWKVALVQVATRKEIARIPIGQAPQALVYVSGAVPVDNGTSNLAPLGESQRPVEISLAAPGSATGGGLVVVRALGLIDTVDVNVFGLEATRTYVVALEAETTRRWPC